MLRDLWISFRTLPLWVQIWVSLILMPVNLAAIAFLDQPQGLVIAALAIMGMVLNLPILIIERGFTKALALPHILCWVPLVVIVAALLTSGAALPAQYMAFLYVLLMIDTVSLIFDVNDAVS